MFKNKSDWLKKRIESRNEDYKYFYDNKFVPILKTLGLFDLYSNYFNSELDDETIDALDIFLKLLESSKNSSTLYGSINHDDKDVEVEKYALCHYMLEAKKSFCTKNNLYDDFQLPDKYYTIFNEYIKKKYEEKVSTLFNKMQNLSNQDLYYIQMQLSPQIIQLMDNLEELIDNYIRIDKNSSKMDELVLQEIKIHKSDSQFINVFQNIVKYFQKTDFYKSVEFKKIKEEIETYKKDKKAKTKNKSYWDDLRKLEKKLDLLIKEQIDKLNNSTEFTFDEKIKINKIIDENLQKYPELFNILKTDPNETEQIRINANYSAETLSKRYTTAAKDIKNLTIRFNPCSTSATPTHLN